MAQACLHVHQCLTAGANALDTYRQVDNVVFGISLGWHIGS